MNTHLKINICIYFSKVLMTEKVKTHRFIRFNPFTEFTISASKIMSFWLVDRYTYQRSFRPAQLALELGNRKGSA